jgi:hypothetical protein
MPFSGLLSFRKAARERRMVLSHVFFWVQHFSWGSRFFIEPSHFVESALRNGNPRPDP